VRSRSANKVTELYFGADVGIEPYDVRDSVEPKPRVWSEYV
jgi:hypothetical protein